MRTEIFRALLECSLSENGIRMRRWIPRFGWKLSGFLILWGEAEEQRDQGR